MEVAFLAQLHAEPNDEVTWQALADWLDAAVKASKHRANRHRKAPGRPCKARRHKATAGRLASPVAAERTPGPFAALLAPVRQHGAGHPPLPPLSTVRT
jgi:hypothetical protein